MDLINTNTTLGQRLANMIAFDDGRMQKICARLFDSLSQGNSGLDLVEWAKKERQPLAELEQMLLEPTHWTQEIFAYARPFVTLQSVYKQEVAVYHAFLEKSRASASPILAENSQLLLRLAQQYQLDCNQQTALQKMFCQQLHCILGGPGSGKSYLLAVFALSLSLWAHQTCSPVSIAIVAPTGKAVSQLRETFERIFLQFAQEPAINETKTAVAADQIKDYSQAFHFEDFLSFMTLDRLLATPKEACFTLNSELLEYDWVIVDECSMVSLSQFYRLTKQFGATTRAVLVGDPNQLPAIGLGNFFAWMVDRQRPNNPFTDNVSVFENNYRQTFTNKKTSLAAVTAKVVLGQELSLRDFKQSGETLRWIADDVRWAEGKQATPTDVWQSWVKWANQLCKAKQPQIANELMQKKVIICFQRHGSSGMLAINRYLQAQMQHYDEPLYANKRFFSGMPFVVTQNHRYTGMQNGDRGIFLKTERGIKAFLMNAQHFPYGLDPEALPAWECCYALTVHKTQGSQYDQVDVVLAADYSQLNRLDMLYTAMTRAKNSVCLIGSADSLRHTLQTQPPKSLSLDFLNHETLAAQLGR